MRVDVFLKKTLIVKQRAVAKTLCDKGYVRVNGTIAKPAQILKTGDIIELDTGKEVQRFRVARIPGGNVPRDMCSEYAEALS